MRLRGDDLAVSPRLLGTPLERRMFLKRMFYSVPLRYQFLYWYHLLGQGVWRNGATGRLWARLRTEVYRMCEAKVREMRQTGRIPDVPKATHGCFDSRVLASRLQQELLPETLYRKR